MTPQRQKLPTFGGLRIGVLTSSRKSGKRFEGPGEPNSLNRRRGGISLTPFRNKIRAVRLELKGGGGRGRRKRRAPLGDRKWEETFKGAILGPGPFQE